MCYDSTICCPGDVQMEGKMTLTVRRSNRNKLQFVFTCVTTGGPATTVLWLGPSASAQGTPESTLDDPVTATYTHTLTVTDSLWSSYRCLIKNELPSEADAKFITKSVLTIVFSMMLICSPPATQIKVPCPRVNLVATRSYS